MPKEKVTPRKRAPRRSPQEIASLLIEAGRDIVLSEGLGRGIENLSFKRALDRLKSTRNITLAHASIIGRAFEDQEDFQKAVLASLVEVIGVAELDEVSAEILDVLHTADRSTPEGRIRANDELVRRGAMANEKVLAESSLWPIWLGVVAAEIGRNDDEMLLRLKKVLAQDTDNFTALYQQIIDFLGFQVRDPFTLEQLTLSIGSLAEGAVIRRTIISEHYERCTIFLIDGQPWSLLGVAIKGISDMMLELIPDWSPPTDID